MRLRSDELERLAVQIARRLLDQDAAAVAAHDGGLAPAPDPQILDAVGAAAEDDGGSPAEVRRLAEPRRPLPRSR